MHESIKAKFAEALSNVSTNNEPEWDMMKALINYIDCLEWDTVIEKWVEV